VTRAECEQDLERVERARHESALISRAGVMERRIDFDAGYDHRHFGCGHGQHGMTVRFILGLPGGFVQWVFNMPNWVPGNVGIIGDVGSMHGQSIVPATNRPLGDGMATDLGYHSPTPRYEGQEQYGRADCYLLPEGSCYYDGSGLNAVPILEAFLLYGPMAVWAALARYHTDLFGSSLELPAGTNTNGETS
jgi:hypothetical protein